MSSPRRTAYHYDHEAHKIAKTIVECFVILVILAIFVTAVVSAAS
jgi:hypothetical protein